MLGFTTFWVSKIENGREKGKTEYERDIGFVAFGGFFLF